MVERERWSLEAFVAETRATAAHTAGDVTDLRHDVRRLDDRLFQMLLLQVATLATLIGAIVASLLS